MAWEFDVIGWEDWYGEIHEGAPNVDVGDVQGVLAHYNNDETGQVEYRWMYVDAPYQDWDEWYDYIEGIGEDYGFYE